MKYPLIAKNLFSQRRKGLFVINSEEDVKNILLTSHSSRFILQSKIEIEKEFRLVVMGGKVVAIHKEAPRKFVDNKISFDEGESSGGWVEPESVSREMINLSIETSKTLGLDVAGIDACIEKETGKIFIIEVNWGPGLTLDDKISSELPGLLGFIKDSVNK
ncbi:hypothetical protein HY045_01890 [Candidatus Woesebacteria bacterium]|nr:hypothetical protein [Candidatus Woesebacteria bacterium]